MRSHSGKQVDKRAESESEFFVARVALQGSLVHALADCCKSEEAKCQVIVQIEIDLLS
jgi:hypothetical protein